MRDLLGRSIGEFRMDEAEMKELMECSVSHGKVGEQGGVAWRGGTGYGNVGGGDDGGAGGN